MMKTLVSLILTLALIMAFSAPACASDLGMGYAAGNLLDGDSWYDDWENDDYLEDYRIDIENALLEKMFSDRHENDKLPFWNWVDLDGDGLSEIILDNNNGKNGIETVDCRMLKGWGSKIIVTKGNFTVYYWNYETSRADSLIINSDNMFLSLASNGRYLVASTAGGNREVYTLYGYFPQSLYMLSETYTLTYSGQELVNITVSDSFGNTYAINEEDIWFVFLNLSSIVSQSSPLVFYQTS